MQAFKRIEKNSVKKDFCPILKEREKERESERWEAEGGRLESFDQSVLNCQMKHRHRTDRLSRHTYNKEGIKAGILKTMCEILTKR